MKDNKGKNKRKTQGMSKFAIWIALVVLMLFFSVASSGFLTPTNLFNVLRQVAVNGLLPSE